MQKLKANERTILESKKRAISKETLLKECVDIKKYWQLYALLLIPIIYIVVFRYLPMYGAQIAFKNYNIVQGIADSPWVGFDHFIRFFKSPIFGKLMMNTVSLSLYSLIASLPFPILLAVALNYCKSNRYKTAVQMITYMPHFISVVVMVGILIQLLNPQYGIVNNIIKAFGKDPVDFFGRPEYFKSLYVWSGIWQSVGWNSIIYLSALVAIDQEIHEAAMVDGATKLQRIMKIDIPCIMPTIITLFILNLGSFMSTGFEKVFLMQNSLNLTTSEVIDTYVYKMGLASATANFSYSTAIGLFQSLISFILIITVNRISRKVSQNSLW